MVVVRLVFQIKWGRAQQVVEALKKDTDMMQRIMGLSVRWRLLTDLSGPFNTLVQEIEVESLASWEKLRLKAFSDPEFQAAQVALDGLYESGTQEFYTIEATL
jgi:hypothetical protein